MTKETIREILLRHRGSMAEIAASFIGKSGRPIDPNNISYVLTGRSTNKRLLKACEEKAQALLRLEREVTADAA